MRILFVSKRHPQQRDLIDRPYGRFYFLPTLLASRGHHVQVAVCSHRGLPSLSVERDGVRWTAKDFRTIGPLKLLKLLRSEVERFKPDWIVGCSDIWPAWIARTLADSTGAKLAVDAYDNYESYMPWNLPMHGVWRQIIGSADVVTAAGPQLAERFDDYRFGKTSTVIVPMAADPSFVPRDRVASCSMIGLPSNGSLIGYMGGWARNRGTDTLIEAFRLLRSRRPDVRLVLTGRPPARVLSEPGVIPLGYIDDALLPLAMSALHVSCVITADTAFGRYSYPAKLCESMACQVPVVATGTEPVRWMLRNDGRFLAEVGDAPSLAARIEALLQTPGPIAYSNLPSWEKSSSLLESALMGHHAA